MIRINKLLIATVAAVGLTAVAACGGSGGWRQVRPRGGRHAQRRRRRQRRVHPPDDQGDVREQDHRHQLAGAQRPAGDSIGAMSYMVERKGNAGLIAQVTPTWLATPMTVANAQVTLADLTPITLVATEPQVIVTSADSPFNSFTDFVAAAKQSPPSFRAAAPAPRTTR